MKYLTLLSILFALSACDEHQITTVDDPRFTITCLPEVATPGSRANIHPTLIKDVKTGAEYLMVQDAHGITSMKLDPVPVGPTTAEKP